MHNTNIQTRKLLLSALGAAQKAGKAILEVYESDFAVEHKEDKSPLTLADKRAHTIIKDALYQTAISTNQETMPILSEEGKEIKYNERKDWNYFWMVDPLDGTKEFIKRNGEFTVNIALIHQNKPIIGVIYTPVKGTFYFAEQSIGAYKLTKAEIITTNSLDSILEQSSKLPIVNKRSQFAVVSSRSHMSKETEEYINILKKRVGNIEIISRGSSLKLCLVAEGIADVYPRFAPTMEWDIAAGQAIVEQAGGIVAEYNTSNPLKYNKKDLLNPWFLVNRVNNNPK